MNPVRVNYFDMEPKDKAKELFTKMKGFRVMHSHSLKCAKVAVNEIINLCASGLSETQYWNEVLKELDNLKK